MDGFQPIYPTAQVECYLQNWILVTGFWNNQPQQDVQADAGHAAGNCRNQKGQAKPESADAKEFGQAAAHISQHTVMAMLANSSATFEINPGWIQFFMQDF